MKAIEILLIAIGLSMDAVAISMSNAMVHSKERARLAEMAVLLGTFQGVMPLLGYWLGGAFSQVVTRLGGFLVLFILGFIGIKMLCDGLSAQDGIPVGSNLTHRLLLAQAVATSIDAFAVGVSLRAENVHILSAVCIIAITTLLLSLIAVELGKRFGDVLGKKAEIFGGVLLIIIGIKAVF